MLKKYKKKFLVQLLDVEFSEIIKGGAIHLFFKVISVLLGILFSFIITKYYGVAEMGVYSLVNSFFVITSIFSLMGMQTVVLRFIPEHIAKYSYKSAYRLFLQVFKNVIILSVLVAIVSYNFSEFILDVFFHKKYLSSLFILASLFVVYQVLGKFNLEVIRALKEIKTYAFIDVVNSFFKILLLVVATYFFYSQYNPVYVLFCSSIILFIISLLCSSYLFKGKIESKAIVHKCTNKTIAKVAFPMFLTGVMSVIISQTDIVMLGIMGSLDDVGLYSIAAKLASLASFVLSSINSIATPKFSELYHSGKINTLTSVAQKASKLVFWVSLPIIFIFVLFGKYILSIFGEEFVVAYYALLFLVAGQFVNGIAGSVGSFLNMTGHQVVFNRIVILGGTTNIVLNYILIPLHGIVGAAVASMVSVILWNLLASLYIRYKFGFYIGYLPLKLNRM